MDKEINQQNPSLLSDNNIITVTKEDSSPNKHHGSTAVIRGGTGGGGGNDRLKRDEWSEGAVSSLLEAYEKKWVLRNRAKLKGHDWEDVARRVSARANCSKSPKTQAQCKNKVESMKKRYRSESATAADGSSWPLYPRLDLLLRGSAPPPPPPPPQQPHPSAVPQAPPPLSTNPPVMLPEPSMVVLLQHQQPSAALPPPPPLAPQVPETAQNSHGSDGVDRISKEDGAGTKLSDDLSDKIAAGTDSSAPGVHSNDKEKLRSKKLKTKMEKTKKKKKKKKRRKKEEWEIAEGIRWIAEVVLKSEQARMETMKEIEKLKFEAQAKRGEMDLKRTEIIANTQVEIARLFAGSRKGVDSSLRIGRI